MQSSSQCTIRKVKLDDCLTPVLKLKTEDCRLTKQHPGVSVWGGTIAFLREREEQVTVGEDEDGAEEHVFSPGLQYNSS